MLFKNKTTTSQRRPYPLALYTTMVTWLHIYNFHTSAAEDPGFFFKGTTKEYRCVTDWCSTKGII